MIKIVNEDLTFDKLYHITPTSNVSQILSQGLKPPVYLTPDYETIMMEDSDFSDSEYAVFLVDTSELILEEDPEWSEYKEDKDSISIGYICRSKIPPRRLKYLGVARRDFSKSRVYGRVIKPSKDV